MNIPFIKKVQRKRISNEWLLKLSIKTFIDIGSYEGEYLDFARLHFPQASLYAFEPLKNMYRLLKKRERTDKKLKVYPYALGEKNCYGKIFRSSYPPSSSLLAMENLHKNNFPQSKNHQQRRVIIKTLDSVLKSEDLQKNIFIKIDTQGYENKILKGGKVTLKKAAVLLIEVSFQSLYKKQELFHEIYLNLHGHGFILYGFHNQIISPLNGSVLQAHAFFLHKNHQNQV